MNAAVLIDSIVRQTTVLIAEIATATESRPTLAHTADEVFGSLVSALRTHGITNKGIADMFGLTLRTYHKRVARLAEADAQRGRRVREEILTFIEAEESVRKADILARFAGEEEVLVSGLLRDLVTAELIFQAGTGQATVYRVVRKDDLPPDPGDDERLTRMLWIAVYRLGPIGLSDLLQRVPMGRDAAERALETLVADGRVERAADEGGEPRYVSEACFIPPEDPAGWQAAFFDHFQAVVATLAARVRRGARDAAQESGGATFSFHVWRGHPLFDETVALFSETRSRARNLRARVNGWNEEHESQDVPGSRVVFYLGQTLFGTDEEDADGY